MSFICKYLCCCCIQTQQITRQQNRNNNEVKNKKQPTGRYKRLKTKFKASDFVIIDDEKRKAGTSAYPCPICTLYYSRILACESCVNCICFTCYQALYLKNKKQQTQLKCPICFSTTSIFNDYLLPPHSYFDTTTNGFLPKQQRLQIDNQISHNNVATALQPIQQQQV